MASSHLSRKERDAIRDDIMGVSQRPREFFKCPLTVPDMVALWESQFEPAYLQAYKTIRHFNHLHPSSVATSHTWIRVRVTADQLFCFHLAGSKWDSCDFAHSRQLLNSIVTPMEIAQIVSDDKTAALVHWMREVSAFADASQDALVTLDGLLKLPNTAGQLARMVPEIVPFLSPDKQSVCLAQQKASALPTEWASFPREPVHRMLDHIAKCSLLPPCETVTSGKGKYRLGYTDTDTWAERVKE